MRHAIVLAATLCFAAPLAAQFEFRDLEEAQRGFAEFQRQLAPAVRLIEQEARTLATITKAYKELDDNQPRFAVDAALKTLDEFVESEERAGRPLPKELLRYVILTKDAIEKARITASPQDIALAREYIHHDVMHPLQLQVMTNAQKLSAFGSILELTAQNLNRAIGSSLGAVSSGLRK